MIQRLLYSILTAGFDEFKENPVLINDLFQEVWDLSESETTEIRTFFENSPPTIVHGYARRDTTFPAISITLGAENETTEFLGNYIGMEEEEPYRNADIEGAIWQHSYNIYVYTQHPDTCMYYYEMVKSILIGAYSVFNEAGIFQISVKGAELMPDPLYTPADLFVRQFTFTCQREFCRTDVDSRLSKAFQVAGIHVDKSGSPSDVGGVKTLVTTYSEAEDGEP